MLKQSLIILSLLTLIGCSDPKDDQLPQSNYAAASLLKLEQVESYHIPRAYIGRISTNQFTPLSFEYSGTLHSLQVDNGDQVKKGDVLAKLTTQLLNIKLSELHAQLAQNNAQIVLNKHNLVRINKLKEDNYASAQTFDELTAQQAGLSANEQQLSANIDALNYQINRSELIAPFDGIVSNRQIAEGENIQAGSPVLQLIKQNDREVKVGVSTQLASSLETGQIVDVEVNNTLHRGTILRIGQQINTSNRTVNLRIALNEKVIAYNDQLAKVIIDQQITEQGYWVPMSALTDGVRGQWNLLIAQPQNQQYLLERIAVNVAYTTETHAFITGINKSSAFYVSQGVHKFVPQQVVIQHNNVLAKSKS